MSRFGRIVFIFAVCFFIAGCGEDNQSQVNAHIESARQFIAQEKAQTAIVEYRNALNLDPDNDVALFELAEAYILAGQVSSAIRYYNLAANANPETIVPYLRLAQINIQTGHLMEARNYISKVLEISPVSVEAHHLLSGVQIGERDIDSAIETLNKAVLLDDKNIKTYISLARLYEMAQDADKAENAYRAAIRNDTASRDAYMGLARLYGRQNKWDKAETLLKEVLKTPGIKIQKNTDMALFYQGRMKNDLAKKYFQEAVLHGKDKVEPLINLGEFYTRIGEEENAVITMENALAKDPGNKMIFTGLAQIYLHFNRVDKAEETIDKALSIDNNDPDALFQKGRIFMAKNNYKEALNRFDQVITLNNINAQAYYYRALCIQKRGATDRPEQKIFRAAAGMLNNPEEFERDQVKNNLLASITIDPNMIDARLKLAEIYIIEKNIKKAREQMEDIFKRSKPNNRIMTLVSGLQLLEGDIKGAEEILQSIIKNSPGYIPAYIRMAILYRSTDRPDKALEYFQAAFEKNPDQVGIVKMMAGIYQGRKEYGLAIDLVNKTAAKSKPDKFPFFENLKGEIYLADGKVEKAFEFFSSASERAPEYITPLMHMARMLTQKRELNRALDLYKKIEAVNPQYLPSLISMGIIHDTLGNQDQAELYYRKVLEQDPGHVDAANNLAFILSDRDGAIDEAFKYAGIAREKDPKNPNVLDTMGWIFYQKGNYLSAISELEESLKLNPENALTCFHYGMALYRNQEFEKARQYFEKALELNPEFKDAATAKNMLN